MPALPRLNATFGDVSATFPMIESGQRCENTFTVGESPRFASWETGYLQDVLPAARHFVIATEADVIEVLSGETPIWETAEPAPIGAPPPGKSSHLYLGEDDVEIEALLARTRQNKTGANG